MISKPIHAGAQERGVSGQYNPISNVAHENGKAHKYPECICFWKRSKNKCKKTPNEIDAKTPLRIDCAKN